MWSISHHHLYFPGSFPGNQFRLGRPGNTGQEWCEILWMDVMNKWTNDDWACMLATALPCFLWKKNAEGNKTIFI